MSRSDEQPADTTTARTERTDTVVEEAARPSAETNPLAAPVTVVREQVNRTSVETGATPQQPQPAEQQPEKHEAT